MDFEQALQDCGNSLEKLGALTDELAGEIDAAYAREDAEQCSLLHFRFTRLFEYARIHLAPGDYHIFRKKLEKWEKGKYPPLG